ncbi:hypothetical protein ACM41_03235, partial [Bradyrhizobium sp. CCBAU 21362]|nr:hypothetical protein [Bradyrhizobium sp. CCBAU 21362]
MGRTERTPRLFPIFAASGHDCYRGGATANEQTVGSERSESDKPGIDGRGTNGIEGIVSRADLVILSSLLGGCQSRLHKFGQDDKWNFCLTAAIIA